MRARRGDIGTFYTHPSPSRRFHDRADADAEAPLRMLLLRNFLDWPGTYAVTPCLYFAEFGSGVRYSLRPGWTGRPFFFTSRSADPAVKFVGTATVATIAWSDRVNWKK